MSHARTGRGGRRVARWGLVWLALGAACAERSAARPGWTPVEVAAQGRCESGDLQACGTLGRSLIVAARTKADVERGLVLLETACGQGDLVACAPLGDWYRVHDDDRGHARATELLTRACAGRIAEGCRALGDLTLGQSKDAAPAAALFQTACDLSDAEACERVGLLASRTGLDAGGAEELAYTRACDLGRASSCHLLGVRWLHDPARRPAGLALLARACEGGRTASCLAAAAALAPVIGNPPGCAQAEPLAQRACLAGDEDGCAIRYACERAGGRDPEGAQRELRAACDRGVSLACFYWAEGQPAAEAAPEQDQAPALVARAYQLACRGGSAAAGAACARLAVMKLKQSRASADIEAPLSALRTMCDHAVALACCSLADIYSDGRFVPADREQAARFREQTCPSCCDALRSSPRR